METYLVGGTILYLLLQPTLLTLSAKHTDEPMTPWWALALIAFKLITAPAFVLYVVGEAICFMVTGRWPLTVPRLRGE